MPAREPDPELVAAVTEDLARTGKYTTLSHQTLARTAGWAARRHRSRRDATKAARRKLHQTYAAFVTDRALAEAARLTATLDGAGADVTETCRAVLRCHASTAEREPYVADLYTAALQGMARPIRVCDLAAGLNPFAIPWMALPAGSAYHASDIDRRLAELTLALAPHLDVRLTADERDLIADPSPVRADVVLLLKALPTLEQQERGSGARLLAAIDAERIVVSFPAASLGGRRKGMPDAYEARLDALIGASPWLRSDRLEFPSETVYRLQRR
jgi:16S rRNA (guanine(1405)-N(7))-methyltransferase